MELSTKVTTLKERNMERGLLPLQMGAYTQETFSIMKYLGEGSTSGLMARHTMGSGRRIKCMGMALCSGKMESDMKVTLAMIREMGKAHLDGRMEECMMEHGKMENSMEEVNL